MSKKYKYLSGKELEELYKDIEIHPTIKRDDVHSQVEFDFIHEFQKYTFAKITPQYRVQLEARYFILDFLVEYQGRTFGIEIDGKKWHTLKKDSPRDKLILWQRSDIEAIIRFDAVDSYYNPSFCVWFIREHYPFLFKNPVKDWNMADGIEDKFMFHGIYNRKPEPIKSRKFGYSVYRYYVDFMTSKLQEDYHIACERSHKNNIDPFDYTLEKQISIKVMTNNG